MVFSCAALNSYEPMRLAGTWKQYSKKAMPQLMTITFHNATLRNFKWPYHANVMKIFEMVRRRIVRIQRLLMVFFLFDESEEALRYGEFVYSPGGEVVDGASVDADAPKSRSLISD